MPRRISLDRYLDREGKVSLLGLDSPLEISGCLVDKILTWSLLLTLVGLIISSLSSRIPVGLTSSGPPLGAGAVLPRQSCCYAEHPLPELWVARPELY